MEQVQSVPMNPAMVASFGPGGQSYIANLFSGFIIDGTKQKALFQFAQNDNAVPFASVLTNLREAGRIGSTMNFTALQVGWRCIKLGDTMPTQQEIHDLKRYLASGKIELTIGSNETRIAEFSGAHLMNIEEFASETVLTNAFGGTSNPVNTSSWVNLIQPIPLQNNVELGGKFTCNLTAVPPALITASQNWAVLVMFAGIKQTK
jgi:hypothetical protein